MTFYLNRNGQSTPFELEQLRTMAQSGEFKQDEYVFDRRREEWLFPNQIDELKDFWTIGEDDKTVALQLPADFVEQLAARQKAAVSAPEVHQLAAKAVALTPYSAPRSPLHPPEPSSPQPGVAQVIQPRFAGQGGDLLVTMIVGYLLSMVTLGIYLPWFICKLHAYLAASTRIEGTPRGTLQLEFTGKGGDLFVTGLVGLLLTIVTIGFYGPWFLVNLTRFFTANTHAIASDGTRYGARFEATGGELLVALLVGYVLCLVTLGIYTPWFLCNFQRLFLGKLAILEDGNTAGSFSFTGAGGELIGQFLLGILLMVVTFGIYAAWFQVALMQFFARHTTVTLGAQSWRGRFSGTGGELFVLNLVGYLLTVVTIGIYGAWWLVKQLTFQTDHHHFDPQT